MLERIVSCCQTLNAGPDCAAVGGGCHDVSAWMEVAMNEGVSGEEALGLLGRVELLHPPGLPGVASVGVSSRRDC